MVKLVKYKVRGAAILEPVVAIVIISGIVTIASLIFGNIAKKNNNYLLFKAQNQVELLMNDVDVEESESFGFDAFDIDKEVSKYNGLEDLIEVTWIVKDKNSNENLLEQKYLIRK